MKNCLHFSWTPISPPVSLRRKRVKHDYVNMSMFYEAKIQTLIIALCTSRLWFISLLSALLGLLLHVGLFSCDAWASHCGSFSCWGAWALGMQASVIVECWLSICGAQSSCSVACGIVPDQGSNVCLLHWQMDSQPLDHQRSPALAFLTC